MQHDECHPTLIVIGPSATGKSSVVRELAARGAVRVLPTWTTRPVRPDERDGAIEHRFVGDDEFRSLDDTGFFAGTVQLPGLPYHYGLPHLPTAPDRAVPVVLARALFLAQLLPLVACPLVYQVEAPAEDVYRRLVARGSHEREVRARFDCRDLETAIGRQCADRVFVNDGPLVALADAIEVALRYDMHASAHASASAGAAR
jgi:guanylate kinase